MVRIRTGGGIETVGKLSAKVFEGLARIYVESDLPGLIK